jgi:hypothetical protein
MSFAKSPCIRVSTHTTFFFNRSADTGKLLVCGPKLAVLKNVRVLKLERGKSNEFDFVGVRNYRIRV